MFAKEMGAQLDSAADEIDQDRFDRHCEHLLVRDGATAVSSERTGFCVRKRLNVLVATTHETEFDLAGLQRFGTSWSSWGARAFIPTSVRPR